MKIGSFANSSQTIEPKVQDFWRVDGGCDGMFIGKFGEDHNKSCQ